MDCLIDTNFLIALWRKGPEALAPSVRKRFADSTLAMPFIVEAEFLRGAAVAGHDLGMTQAFIATYPTLWPTPTTLRLYAETYAMLRKSGQGLIGPHDLWIAALALEKKLPLLTANAAEFRRVKGIEVVDFTAETRK